ncbi:hypothetical protein VTK26DRAFT_2377 [Humicola hyalothermophila]
MTMYCTLLKKQESDAYILLCSWARCDAGASVSCQWQVRSCLSVFRARAVRQAGHTLPKKSSRYDVWIPFKDVSVFPTARRTALSKICSCPKAPGNHGEMRGRSIPLSFLAGLSPWLGRPVHLTQSCLLQPWINVLPAVPATRPPPLRLLRSSPHSPHRPCASSPL